MGDEVVSLRIPTKLYKALAALAAKEQRTFASLVRYVLTKFIENGK